MTVKFQSIAVRTDEGTWKNISTHGTDETKAVRNAAANAKSYGHTTMVMAHHYDGSVIVVATVTPMQRGAKIIAKTSFAMSGAPASAMGYTR